MLSRGHLSYEKGFTLIEIFVAMIVAMIILGVVSESYLSGLATQRLQSEALRVQESGRFALDLISRSVRRAGYRNTYAAGGSTAREFCSATAGLGSPTDGSQDDPVTIDVQVDGGSETVSILNASDVLVVRSYGEDNPAGTAADGSVIDCLGNSIRRGDLLEETLFISQDPRLEEDEEKNSNDGEPALYCSVQLNGVKKDAQTMVTGVESMQILYGEDTDDDGVTNRYVPSSNVSNPDAVFSAMVSIVVRSANPTTRIVEPVFRFFHFNGTDDDSTWFSPNESGTVSGQVKEVTLPADKRIRRQFDSTISFRNFSQC